MEARAGRRGIWAGEQCLGCRQQGDATVKAGENRHGEAARHTDRHASDVIASDGPAALSHAWMADLPFFRQPVSLP